MYAFAIGFWILNKTGSTALMGPLSAALVAPKVFISPLRGTFADRHNPRMILIISDIICGIATLFVGISTVMRFVEIWMIVGGAIIIGICGCFFNSAINSSMLDIVPKSKILQANSAFSLMSTANGICGKAIGRYLVQILGVPMYL